MTNLFSELMAVISATVFLGIVTSSPRADTFNLLDIIIFVVFAFIIGYSWMVCGQDHEAKQSQIDATKT